MQKLQETGLFGGGLVRINSPRLVERYNKGLALIGVPPTSLTEFEIDGIGWSPQVAEEKGRIKYFSPNADTQFALILTPDQKGLPIYTPFNSFDRALMEKFFMQFAKQIADVTQISAICLDIAGDITHFGSPLDLLMIESTTVKSSDVESLMKAAVEQRKLVSEFRSSEKLWADTSFCEKLIASAESHGDLRFRAITIPDMNYTEIRSFYTRAFGGTYVFRDIKKAEYLLVLEDDTQADHTVEHEQIWLASDIELPGLLIKEDLAEVTLSEYREKPGLERIEKLRGYLFAHAYYANGGEEDLTTVSDTQKRSWLSEHKDQLPAVYFELERLTAQLRKGTAIRDIEVSDEAKLLLMHPDKKHRDCTRKVVWQLLTRLVPYDVEHLFVYNRVLFYTLYRAWSAPKQVWAINQLKAAGYPHQTVNTN